MKVKSRGENRGLYQSSFI